MKLEVGMYARITTGFDVKMSKPIIRIGKIEDISDYCITINVFSRLIIVSLKEFEELKRKEPSFNIIDVLEVGDYVNGCLIVEIKQDPFIKGQINLWTNMILSAGEPFPNEYYKAKILEKDIKSIVTKEQFESMEYRVGE